MSAKPLSLLKIVSGRSLARKEDFQTSKARSSSAESKTKISLKSIILKKSKENLIPKEKIIFKQKPTNKPQKLQRLDLNIKEVNNSFYKKLTELENKLSYFELTTNIPENLISPVKLYVLHK